MSNSEDDNEETSHPLVFTKAETRGEVERIFDSITYGKGAAVVSMIRLHMMGEENFLNAINEYLRTYAFKNAETEDLIK